MVSFEDVLEFWLGPLDENGRAAPEKMKTWFQGGPELDREIRERFEPTWNAIMAGERQDWLGSARGRLATVIVLDQLSRNMFRNTATMYAGDERAVGLALDAIERGDDKELALAERTFLYMPLMHAEDVALQDTCVALFESMRDEVEGEAKKGLDNNVGYARRHRDVVARFGRFPHRNAILGRESTPDEAAFLVEMPGGF